MFFKQCFYLALLLSFFIPDKDNQKADSLTCRSNDFPLDNNNVSQ